MSMAFPFPKQKNRFPCRGGNDSVRLPVPHGISFPYAGIIQIRFNGYDLRLCAKPPRVRLLFGVYLKESRKAVKAQMQA